MENGKAEQDTREYLRHALVEAIKEKYEFGFLEDLCYEYEIEFDELIYDPCLDRYISLRLDGESQFKSKYASLFITSWKILYLQNI